MTRAANLPQWLEALKRKKITVSDFNAVRARCSRCDAVGASNSTQTTVKRGAHRLDGVRVNGATRRAPMATGKQTSLDKEVGIDMARMVSP